MPYKDKDSQAAKENSRLRAAKWRARHPEKAKAVRDAHYYRHQERRKAYAREWHFAHRESQLLSLRKRALKRNYGLTVEQYEALGGHCHICGATEDVFWTNDKSRKKRLHVDHLKGTKTVRGLLCGRCNFALGHFDHDCDRMQKAIAYLKRFEASLVAS